MDVASLSHVPVGVLGWNSPDPSFTIVVKATFSMTSGRVALAAEQEPIGNDRAHPHSETELYAASDFAPQKRGVDLLLVGHARASRPSTVLPFALTVGATRILLHAVADTPQEAIPLLERHVRRKPADTASAVRLAPRRTAVRGWLSRTVAPGFEFAAFNAAPPEHRMDELPADARLVLEGMSIAPQQREMALPGLAAYSWLVEDRGALREAEPVPMRCDTLWIDVDRDIFTLTWRGVTMRRPPPHRHAAVVLLDAAHAPAPWHDVRGRVAEDSWRPAVQSHDLAQTSRPQFDSPDAAPSEREPTLSAAWAMGRPARADDEEPTLSVPEGLPGDPSTMPGGGTLEMDEADSLRAALADAGTPRVDEGKTVRMPTQRASRGAPPSRRQRATDPMPQEAPDSTTPVTRVPPLSLDVYVRILAALDGNADQGDVLKAENLGLRAWEQAHAFWTERSRADAAVDAELQARLRRARQAR